MTTPKPPSIQFDEIVKKARGNFHGGIHPQDFKSLSNQRTITDFALPPRLVIPIQQSAGEPGKILINQGDTVTAGERLVTKPERLGANVHAPLNGQVVDINHAYTGHPSGLPKLAITLETDAKTGITQSGMEAIQWQTAPSQTLINRIRDAGIVGLGGATFPTDVKLDSSGIQTLIVNAMECEPYITCDDRLLRESSQEVVLGAQIAAKIVGAQEIIFATEDNKPEAIEALNKTIRSSGAETVMSIIVAPTKYPSGGEKQTLELVTGNQLPSGKLPSSMGIVMQNVATLYAVYDAVCNGLPLIKRLVTLTGDLVQNPGNYWIAFGTPFEFIMDTLEIDKKDCEKIIMGGPLMGQSINDFSTPVTKATNCLIFNRVQSSEKLWLTQSTNHQPCIRCSECQIACPAELMPQQLYWFSATDQWENSEQQGLFDCIECGACAYVCPSEIPLVQYYRYAKSSIRKLKHDQENSERAKQRFDYREMRIQRNKAERALKHEKAAEARQKAAESSTQDPSGKQTAINDALQRVKQKKTQLKAASQKPNESN